MQANILLFAKSRFMKKSRLGIYINLISLRELKNVKKNRIYCNKMVLLIFKFVLFLQYNWFKLNKIKLTYKKQRNLHYFLIKNTFEL